MATDNSNTIRTSVKLWMRHATFERAMRGVVAMTAKYPGKRFAVGHSHLVAGHGWLLVEVVPA